jgi:hypothetical protein
MEPPADSFDEYESTTMYENKTVVRISIRRTAATHTRRGGDTRSTTTLAPSSETLDDGTIRRYDTAHETTKSHERHVAPDSEPEIIEFPGIEELYERFWNEIPKSQFGPSSNPDNTHE